MAQRRKAGKLIATPAGIPAASPPNVMLSGDGSEFPDAMQFLNSLSQSRDGIEWDIRVYQLTGSMGRGQANKQLFLFNCTLEDLPTLETNLAQEYPGGGSFRVQVRADSQLVKNISLEIAPRPGYMAPAPSYLARVAAPIEAPPAPTDRLETILARMMEFQGQQTRDLIAAIAGKQSAPAPTITEQLAMFAEFQKLIPKGAQENGFEMFQKGMDMALKMAELRGDGGSGTNWMDIIKDAINSPVVRDMLAGAVAAGQASAAPALAPPPSLLDPNNPQVAGMMDTILKQAAAGIDPKTVAQQISEHAPPALMFELEQQENIPGYIVSKFPHAAPYAAWLAAVVANIWEEGDNDLKPSPTLAPIVTQTP